MISFEFSFHVSQPIDLVFDLISDFPNYPRWVPSQSNFFLENKVTSKGPFGLGTTYVDRLRFGGKSVGEIVEYTKPSRVAFHQKTYFGVAVFSSDIEYILTSENGGTTINHRFTARGHGLFFLMEPVLSRIIRPERMKTCKAIKLALDKMADDASHKQEAYPP